MNEEKRKAPRDSAKCRYKDMLVHIAATQNFGKLLAKKTG